MFKKSIAAFTATLSVACAMKTNEMDLKRIEPKIKIWLNEEVNLSIQDKTQLCKEIIKDVERNFSNLDDFNEKSGVQFLLGQALNDINKGVDLIPYYTVDYFELYMGNLTSQLVWELCDKIMNFRYDLLAMYKDQKAAKKLGPLGIWDQGQLGSCTANSLTFGNRIPSFLGYNTIRF